MMLVKPWGTPDLQNWEIILINRYWVLGEFFYVGKEERKLFVLIDNVLIFINNPRKQQEVIRIYKGVLQDNRM